MPDRNGPAGVWRRALDGLYWLSGAAAALCLVGTCVLMLAQAGGRSLGTQVRGADDITAWLCAATAFFALAHTFKSGDFVRVGLFIDRFRGASRRRIEIAALSVSLAFVAYMAYWLAYKVYDSWLFNDMSQGILVIPIWIPQLSLPLGAIAFMIAVVDELAAVLRGRMPAYEVAAEERRARGDFSETV